MTLQLAKKMGGLHTISYQREDGSETWTQADDFLVLHDLSHFVIEMTMGYRTAFMGMINQGVELKDFENRVKRPNLEITYEGKCAENLANLFLIEIVQGYFEDFNQVFRECFEAMNPGLSAPILNVEEIFSIRRELSKWSRCWKDLAPGHTMSLGYIFPGRT
jgi:hypothetical protein